MTADRPPAARPLPSRVFLRPMGTPLPLGFFGLVVATSVLSCLNLGWIPTSEQHQVAFVLMVFAFPLQLIASVLLFLVRSAPAGAGIGVQSVTWLTLGLMLYTGHPGSRSAAAGVLLFAAAGALLPSALTASLSKLVLSAVMLLVALRWVLTGMYEKFGGTAWEHASGWEGLVVAAVALYAAFGADLEAALRRSVLPMGRHGRGLQALEQNLADQEPALQHEPGVRQEV